MNKKLDDHAAAYKDGNIYNYDNNILLNWYPRRIILNSNGARSILEFGLGHGLTANAFAVYFQRHVVLEGSSTVIGNFKQKYPDCKATIIETYFEEFVPEEKFDVIVMGFILEHVDDPLGIICHYKQYLEPGGNIYLTVPNAEVLNRRLGQHASLLENIEELSENDIAFGHKRYFSVASLSDLINRSGCKLVKMEGIYLKPFTTSQMISLKLDEKIIRALCEVGIDYPELSCGILAQISA